MGKRREGRAGARAKAQGLRKPAGGSGRTSGGGSGSTVAGLAVLAAVLAGGTYVYRHTGMPSGQSSRSLPASRPTAVPRSSTVNPPTPGPSPVHPATSIPAQPSPTITGLPVPPFGTSEEVFESGARLYAANCAGCHGRPEKNGKGPSAAQFWDRSNAAGTHAITQPAGELYQATAKGNLVAGMPSYGQRLTDTQIWDLALLLKSAHEDLPNPVLRLLRGGQ